MEKFSSILVGIDSFPKSPQGGDNAISFVGFILQCIILSIFITLLDFYSCFWLLLRNILHFLFGLWKGCFAPGKSANSNVSRVSTLKFCSREKVRAQSLSREEIETVMERLGMSNDSEPGENVDSITSIFDEMEPNIEEMKEAFHLFDENEDGYIDAKELKKILCIMGFAQFSEKECQHMIMAFDANDDGRIEFSEFLKLVEHSFS